MKHIFFFLVFFLSMNHLLVADDSQKAAQEMAKFEKQRLQILQQTDPQAYREALRANALAEEIAEIVSRFKRGEISEPDARKRLTPLVKGDLKPRLQYLDEEITDTEKRLEYLKQIKRNPNFLVEETINAYLAPPKPLEAEPQNR